MATDKQSECMRMEEGVAGERDYIETEKLFDQLKKEDKRVINSLIKSLLSAP